MLAGWLDIRLQRSPLGQEDFKRLQRPYLPIARLNSLDEVWVNERVSGASVRYPVVVHDCKDLQSANSTRLTFEVDTVLSPNPT